LAQWWLLSIVSDTWELEIGRIIVGGLLGEKVGKAHYNNKPCMPLISATKGGIDRRIVVQAGLGKK
jgi:hypothetical protein